MPKKHQPSYLTSHGHGASSSTKPPAAQGSPRTVNERLEQLRREQSPRLSIEKTNEIVTVANQRTIPPQLRHLLALPETAPVRRRHEFRFTGRRFAGPPPPKSWLEASRHAPLGERVRARRELLRAQRASREERLEGLKMRHKPERLNSLATAGDNPHPLPEPRSLSHLALKTMAMNWDWLSEFEEQNLALLPNSTKSSLLTYISLYGPSSGIDLASIRSLFDTDVEVVGFSGVTDISQLDFTGLLSHELTLVELTRFLNATIKGRTLEQSIASVTLDERPERIAASTALLGKTTLDTIDAPDPGQLLDSWEDEGDVGRSSIPASLKLSRFPNVTRLSLAHAGSYASWKQLLSLSTHLSTITHLSLAWWPTPSVTPNSKTAFVSSRHGEINFGGSHLYSVLDEDWYEAANILRRLSKNTYCLQWLDLEGCIEWLPALTWQGSQAPPDRWIDRAFHRDRRTPGPQSSDMPNMVTQGSDWNGSWSQVKYVNVAQGFVPSDIAALRRLPSGLVAAELLLYLRERDHDLAPRYPLVEHCDVPTWLEAEKQARKVEAELRLLRSQAKGAFCRFDHGWEMSRAWPLGSA